MPMMWCMLTSLLYCIRVGVSRPPLCVSSLPSTTVGVS